MNKKYQSLLKKIEKIEESYGSLENFVCFSTYKDIGHKLKIDKSIDMSSIYLDLLDLEKADLLDFKNMFGSGDGF